MLHTKRLAHRDKEAVAAPKHTKKLCFGTIVLLSALSSCASAKTQVGKQTTTLVERTLPKEASVPELSMETEGCDAEASLIARPGEKVLGMVCRKKHDYVMTEGSLLATFSRVKRDVHPDAAHPVAITDALTVMRTDISDLQAQGITAWTASDNDAFVLTSDGILNVLPIENWIPESDRYQLDRAGGTAKMAYFSDLIFIATSERLVVMSYKDRDFAVRNIEMDCTGADFTVSGGRLFLVKGNEKTEIKTDGDRLDAVCVGWR
jgi:hypothetical protein